MECRTMVVRLPVKEDVLSSSLSVPAIRNYSIVANTPPCHGGNTGSIPVSSAKIITARLMVGPWFLGPMIAVRVRSGKPSILTVRLTVGHLLLAQVIGVRVPDGQPNMENYLERF